MMIKAADPEHRGSMQPPAGCGDLEKHDTHSEGIAHDEVKFSGPSVSKKNIPEVEVDMTEAEKALSKRVSRRMDFAILPVLSLLYLFNGLDKGNVGNAETQGKCK
jgi:hypothetical protein